MKYNLYNVPENSGVYIMKNSKGKIIYIGKAKNIKKRVSSYFNKAHNKKTMELVKNIADIDYFICNTEIEAFILENNLIKEHKPKYNILLKDEKTYPYIKITKEKIPKISISRKPDKKAYYFGPFPYLNMKTVINTIIKVFKIRDCKIDVYKQHNRPCLKYHLNLCNAPCVYKTKQTFQEYDKNIKYLLKFLNNKDTSIIDKMREKMNEYSEAQDYENAIIEREKIKSFMKLQEYQITESTRDEDEDIFTFDIKDNNIFLCVISVRKGKMLHKESNLVENVLENEYLLDRLIANYYENRIAPKTLILESQYENRKDLLTLWFKQEKNKNVNILFPKKKGRAYDLLKLSNINLVNEQTQYYSKKDVIYRGLRDLQEKLNLKKLPNRIECFDVSNIQGTNPTTAMTVAINGKLKPSEYRLFNIKSKNTPDDFAMMREALTRRYSKLDIENLPDVILIDGGKGQISVAVSVLEKLGKIQYLDILSIAKKEELIFKDIEKEPYIFSRYDESLRILQRLRDEAHRFSITQHRKLRSKRVMTSELDEIKGIGEKRKKELLRIFKTVENVFNANETELLKVLPKSIVEKIIKKM